MLLDSLNPRILKPLYQENLQNSLGLEKFNLLTQEQRDELFEASIETHVQVAVFQEILLESVRKLHATFIPDPFEGRAILQLWQSSAGKVYNRNHPYISKRKRR